MRGYSTKIVIDMSDGHVIEKNFIPYCGPWVLCKGGGGGEPDREYNRRMANIAERQQGMAEEYMDFWRESYKPMEEAQIAANIELIPSQVSTEKAKLSAEAAQARGIEELVPYQVAQGKAESETAQVRLGVEQEAWKKESEMLPERYKTEQASLGSMQEFYKQALSGVDVDERVRQARADVGAAYADEDAAFRRSMGRYGVNVSDPKFAALKQRRLMERAKATAGAMTGARTKAEEESFRRLSSAANTQYRGGIAGG